jgi:hypothetical protein
MPEPQTVEEAPPRLTPTQRLHEVTLAALSRVPRDPTESITLSRNAKGDMQFELNVVTRNGETLEEARERATSAAAALHELYPLSRAQIDARQTIAAEKGAK